MKIMYRLFTPDDIDSLCELWNDNAEWGPIEPELWKKVFYHTPFGPSTIVLAIDKGTQEVVAQFVFIPTRISVNGTEVKGFKPCAPIIKKSLREEAGLASVFLHMMKMYRFATKYFVSQGIYLLHMMPDPRWARSFEAMPGMKIAKFPLWCFSLEKKIDLQLPDGYTIEDVSPQDPQIDELWNKTKGMYDCIMIRNSEVLPYKLSHRNYESIGIKYKSRLVGFAALLYKDIIKGVIICDVLAEDETTLKLMLEAARFRASKLKYSLPESDQFHCEKVSVLAIPLIEKIVTEMGFTKNNYKSALAVHVLGKELSKKELKPERWYVSAND
ncbi:MAG: hypothetical protein H7325_02105 [Pedobacter sp.]|nr:hypothetical protein [Pedobacter sp.]